MAEISKSSGVDWVGCVPGISVIYGASSLYGVLGPAPCIFLDARRNYVRGCGKPVLKRDVPVAANAEVPAEQVHRRSRVSHHRAGSRE